MSDSTDQVGFARKWSISVGASGLLGLRVGLLVVLDLRRKLGRGRM